MSDIFNQIVTDIGDIGDISFALAGFISNMPVSVSIALGLCIVGAWTGVVIKLLVD